MNSVASTLDRHEHITPLAGETTPILWWAAIGAFFVALQVYIFGAWIMSPHFTPTPTGDSPLAWYSLWEIWIIQLGAPLLWLGLTAWFVSKTIQQGHVPTLWLIVLGWSTVVWQDPLVNYVRPTFSYNSHFVNFGSWCELVPGWLAPNGSKMPEPLGFDAGAYMVVIPMTAVICAFAMRLAKRRWPSIGTPQLILVAFVVLFFCDLFTEGFLVATQMYAYTGVVHAWSLFPNTLHQFPIYESILGGATITATGSLYYFRDDKGNTLVERGLQSLTWKRGKEMLRILAVAGFVNVVVLTYNIFFVFLSLQLDPWPKGVPSYLRNEMCGEGTQYECPGDDVHIPLPKSGPLLPFTGRN